MRIAVIGPLEVRRDDGAPVPVPGAKERLLLAVLAAGAPDVVSTDRLVESLWDDGPPATARKSLQAHLVRLRSALEPDRPQGSTGRYVVRRGAGYALALDRASLDALRMPDLAARGRAELAAGHADVAVEELRAAVELWRGEPYADWPDAPFAGPERRRLAEVRSGAVEGLLTAELALGRHADVLPELERLVAEEPLQERWWRLLMLALYRAGRQADALGAGRRARALLAEELGTDPGPGLRAMEAAIFAQDPAIDLVVPTRQSLVADGHQRPAAAATCPYKGLAAYQAADAALFRGRARLVAGLVGRLADASLLVVSGPSGAGKSSVVRAGLVPALAGGALPDSASWRPVVVTPGRTPVDVLAGLTGDPPPAAPVVLVCDQFEELWAPVVDPGERAAFLDALLGLLDDGIAARCVAVVRGDHVGRLAEHAGFAERVGGALVLVPALTDAELREVVREPAGAVGLTAEPELVDAVVADVLGRPGALPLLSTALVGTWERRRDDRLTLAGYLGAGGVAGALTRSAESAYAALDDVGRDTARHLLVRLADVDDAGALVRRPVPLAELDLDGEGGGARRQVMETFVNRRLLSVDGERLQVAHEALLTGWPRLAGWLEDDAAGRTVRRHLAPAAREWAERGDPDEELYRGARLAAALDWAGSPDADVTPVERRFLEASRARADAELDEARERARREARARRRTRRLAVGLAAVLVVALVAGGLALRSRRAAERLSTTSDADRLAALSDSVESLDLAYLLAAQGFRVADTPQTRDALFSVLAEHRRVARAVPFPPMTWGGRLADGGRTLFIAGGDRILSWNVPSDELPGVILELDDSWLGWRATDGSPTDDIAAMVGMNKTLGSWLRLLGADGKVRAVWHGEAIGGRPFGVSFTPDGRWVDVLVAREVPAGAVSTWRLVQIDPVDGTRRETGVSGSLPAGAQGTGATIADDGSTAVLFTYDGSASPRLVDLSSGTEVALRTPDPKATEQNVDYRALPSGAVQMRLDGTVTVYDRTGAVIQELQGLRQPVYDVALAPDGTWAATGGESGEVALWDVDPSTGRWSMRESLPGHAGTVQEVEIDATGKRLFTLASDDTVIVWDVDPDGGFGAAHPGLPGRWLANRPEVVDPGRLIVAPTRPLDPNGQEIPYAGAPTLEVAATFLDPRTGEVVDQVPVGDTAAVPEIYFGASVAVSTKHPWVAVASGLATTVLDTRTREEVTAPIVLPATDYPGADGKPLPAGVAWSVAWSPDGSKLLIGTDEKADPRGGGEIAVVDTDSWRVVDSKAVPVVPEVMAVSPDGRSLAVSGGDGSSLVFLDPGTLQVRHDVPLRGDDRVSALSFSPDGRFVAAGGLTGGLHLADTRTWEARDPVLLHESPLLQIEWLEDGRTVASTGVDGTVSLFDTRRGVVRAKGLPASVHGEAGYARLVPDPGDELVALNDQHVGLSYPLDADRWLREACAVVGRDLTRAEWARYLPGREYRPTCSDLG